MKLRRKVNNQRSNHPMQLTEKQLLAALKSSLAINALADALDVMTQIAAVYIADGMTQEGADVLAYVMRHPATPDDVQERALDHWDDLECWICPRVLLDANDFASKAHFDDIVEYIYAGT
jgi:hypothetical protein